MLLLALQIIVIACFIIVIIALFREKTDFLTYSMAAMFLAVVATFIFLPDAIIMEEMILSVEWEVIFFLIFLFTIVEILEDKKIFQEIALRITEKFHTNTRKFFWVICLISTISAAFIEDVSVAIIFVPIIISTCKKMKINPAPILMGMTICINLASTLTPFGSAENILIANEFNLTSYWFFVNLGLYFIISTLLTLFLLDYFNLKKHIKEIWIPHCMENDEPLSQQHLNNHELIISEEHIDSEIFYRNLIVLLAFFVMLVIIPNFLFVSFLGLLIFIFINPRKSETGKNKVDLSFYFKKVDYKIIFFFISLFILVFCMEINGTMELLDQLVIHTSPSDLFLLCIFILIITSILSGFLDNIPVTIIFIPIISTLIGVDYASIPLLIAFILGINLGGNIFPQGSAADMMTLELSEKYCVEDMNYKSLLKTGGMFAILHIIIGIIYLGVLIFLFF
ncbi:MAG: SLC13 family permease [Promethearchaeota archaeon]